MTKDMMTLGAVAQYINGRAFKPKEWESTGVPIVRIQNLNDPNAKYNYSNQIFEEKYLVRNGDLLFAWAASLGTFIWRGKNAWLNQHIFKIEPKPFMSKRFLYYFLLRIISDLYRKTHGSGMVHITKTPFMSTPVWVPDKTEQERIVAKLDELFSDLDAAEVELKQAKARLEVFRNVVLDKAFSGKLCLFTKFDDIDELLDELAKYKKKEKHFTLLEKIRLSTLPSDWKWLCVGDISSGVEYGSAQKSKKNGRIPVLRMGNIQNGSFMWDDLLFSSDEDEIKKYNLFPNDVLFNRTNSPELVGKSAIYSGERAAIFAGYLIRVNHISEMVDSKYLNYFLNSNTAKRYGNLVKTDGVNQSNINGTKLCSYPFPFCSLWKQKQIVQTIEAYISIYNVIDECITLSIQKIARLRESILRQAFEGDL